MSKNVAVFVDVANIFYAAKAAGVDIDYVTLLKSASAGRDLVRAYAYTGLDPDNENQRNFHNFLARHGYRVVSKDIRKYGDGKVKANLDIELVVDMMKTARNLDIAIVVSGDGDFAPAIRAVQEMGVRVEVISFRGNTSSDLIDVADLFTDITALAKVEKGSSRSGRRVAEVGEDEDLSMTEVPDKQTEGTGDRRGRGGRGGRGRGRPGEAEPATRSRRPAAAAGEPAALTSSGAPLVVLPGEKLSRVAPVMPTLVADTDEDEIETTGETAALDGSDTEVGEDGRRRRRRRGGRGRGRGRGRAEGGTEGTEPSEPGEAVVGAFSGAEPTGDEDEVPFEAPRGPRTTPFGSVWDSQLGVPSQRTGPVVPLGDDEDFEEPEIPEYLLTERRGGQQRGGRSGTGGGGQRGGRGGNRSAYAAAMDRERYGRGGGGGGINRYPDVSGRERDRAPERDRGRGRDDRPRPTPVPQRSASGDPWSEVPPELEAMLRAQMGTSGGGRDRRDRPAPSSDAPPAAVTEATPAEAVAETVAPRRGRRPAAASSAPDMLATDEAPKRRTTRRAAAPTPSAESAPADDAAAPKRRTTRRTASAAAETAADGPATETAPKRRTTRRTTAPADAGEGSDATAAAPKPRATRRKAADEPVGG